MYLLERTMCLKDEQSIRWTVQVHYFFAKIYLFYTNLDFKNTLGHFVLL